MWRQWRKAMINYHKYFMRLSRNSLFFTLVLCLPTVWNIEGPDEVLYGHSQLRRAFFIHLTSPSSRDFFHLFQRLTLQQVNHESTLLWLYAYVLGLYNTCDSKHLTSLIMIQFVNFLWSFSNCSFVKFIAQMLRSHWIYLWPG